MTQEQFIESVKNGQEPLRRFLLALCNGNDAVADDIAQDALVRAYVASAGFKGLSRFSTWLFRIAYNCFVDHYRRKGPEHTTLENREALSVRTDDTADASFRYEQLYQALEKLPEKEKAAVALFYFEDMKIKEIAAVLQLPSGTVKYLLSQGRNRLKEHIRL